MKKILSIVVVLAVVLVGWMLLRNKRDIAVNTSTPTVSPTSTPLVSPFPSPAVSGSPASSPSTTTSPSPVISKNLITYTDSGYAPNTITIKKGETVTWKNESKLLMWTASAVHPTHKAYPGTNIANCGTPAGSNQFDACRGVASGQSWSFKFDNVGTWGYHNHLKASDWGKIVVE